MLVIKLKKNMPTCTEARNMNTDDKKDSSSAKQERLKLLIRIYRWICRHKFKLLLLLLISFPIAMDRFFAYEGYQIWAGMMDVLSPMTVQEWFSFLGSYAGAVGTIIVGIVAYVQSNTIRAQDKALQELEQQVFEMQKAVNSFQLNPVIWVEKASIRVRKSPNLREKEKIEKELRQLYFSQFGEEREFEINKCRYVEICGLLKNTGIVPVFQSKINNISWKIGKNLYEFSIEKDIFETRDRLYILVQDNMNCKQGTEEEFWDDLYRHYCYKNNHYTGYDKSILKVTCQFKTLYDVEYNKDWEQLQQYEIECKVINKEDRLEIENIYIHRKELKHGN